MPELPEVQTIVTDLEPVLPGLKFQGISTTHSSSVISSIPWKALKNKRAERPMRRGKFIVVEFEDDLVVTMHLRMSGRLLIRDHDDPELRFERHRLDFDKISLRFCDQRKFGRIWLSHKANFEQETGIHKLGVEPFSDEFTLEYFTQLMTAKRGPIKKHLLDQSLIAGIGNIYADEACFYAGLRPTTDISSLTSEELNTLYESAIRALRQGVENRGTSISDYADAYGSTGRNQEEIYVYGRKGKPCLNCKTPLTGIRLVGRGTVFCENCQK